MKSYDVCIVGSSGFVGGHLLNALGAKGFEVLALSRERPPQELAKDFKSVDLSAIEFGWANTEKMHARLVIFNSALKGRFQIGSAEFIKQGSVTAPDLKKLFGALNLSFDRLVTIGSSEEYGPVLNEDLIKEDVELHPASSYGFWKAQLYEATLGWQKSEGFDYVHLRPFNIIGVGLDENMFVGGLIKALLSGSEFKMTKGEQYRSFLSVDTLIKVILKLTQVRNWSDYSCKSAMNVSDSYYRKLVDVAREIADRLNRREQLLIGALEYRADEVWHQRPCLKYIRALLGDSLPLDFDKEIDKIIESMKGEYGNR